MCEKLLAVAHSKDCNTTSGPGANLQQNSPGTTLQQNESDPRVLVNSPKNQLAKIALVKSPNYFGQLAKFLWSTRQIPLVNSPKNIFVECYKFPFILTFLSSLPPINAKFSSKRIKSSNLLITFGLKQRGLCRECILVEHNVLCISRAQVSLFY